MKQGDAVTQMSRGNLDAPSAERRGLRMGTTAHRNIYTYSIAYGSKIQPRLLTPNPQVAAALSGLKPVMVQVKLALALHPSGAAEKAQNLTPPHVKNVACGFGFFSGY